MTTRTEADDMALKFLADNGPHALPNPLETDEEFCAALVFIGLHRRGLVDHTDHGGGRVKYSINEAGRSRIECQGRA